MSCRIIDSTYGVSITPSRKRKRESSRYEVTNSKDLVGATNPSGCFTNAAFSSTPKKLLAKRLLPKEGLKPFVTSPGGKVLEVKSILDIVQDPGPKQTHITQDTRKIVQRENPYEVVRKPPKKKKKRTECIDACFENPALNLELPEKQFNPFEIRRSPRRSSSADTKAKCFTNEALNIRGQDIPSRNPFEISRSNDVTLATSPIGFENAAVDTGMKPSTLRIGLPFTPTLGCRIDFKNLPLSELTPGKLLPERLEFSPVPILETKTPKRSLSSINEETVDIGKELDCYQLELENSINEAKLRKCGGDCEVLKISDGEKIFKPPRKIEIKADYTQKLSGIAELEEEEEETQKKFDGVQFLNIETHTDCEDELSGNTSSSSNATDIKNERIEIEKMPLLSASLEMSKDAPLTSLRSLESINNSDEEEQNDSLDFTKPSPFVRAYRRSNTDEEHLYSNKPDDKACNLKEQKKTTNVKHIIRNSIRKLIHSNTNDKERLPEGKEPVVSEKDASVPSSIMSSIRHSLRRKSRKQMLPGKEVKISELKADNKIHAVDSTELTLKLKSNLLQTDYIKIEDLTTEKKNSMRNSLKKSTRCVRQQFLKNVFSKNYEEYELKK